MRETCSGLVRGISDFGDHQRWYEFERVYGPMIRKILRNKGLGSDEIEDGVQEVFLSLLSTVERFRYDRSKGKFRSWLSKITQRTAIAVRKKRSAQAVDPQQLEETQPDFNTLVAWDDERMQLCLRMAREHFEEKTWLPFYLRVIEECPIAEVERITGMNRNAIYQAVFRVKACLRQMLGQLSSDDQEEPQET